MVAASSAAGRTETVSILMPRGSGGSEPRDFQRLSKGKIDVLIESGYHPHDLKPQKGGSRFDIFKDGNGDLYVMPRDGKGPGDPLGMNINDLWE